MNKILIPLIIIIVGGCQPSSKNEKSTDPKAETGSVTKNVHPLMALAFDQDYLTDGVFKNSEFSFFKPLNNDVRGGRVYDSPDSLFSMSVMDLVMDDNTSVTKDYTDFNRHEFMFYLSGGMKLTDPEGNVAEASAGEMLFIPKGWGGARLFTGKGMMTKFSIVYWDQNEPGGDQAFDLGQKAIDEDLYADADFEFIEMLNGEGRGYAVFESKDGQFKIGGLHLKVNENFNAVHEYENFPRNELMYFTRGGIRLEDEFGNVAEAGEGEFAFIPKGYNGTRTFLDSDGEIRKFSFVYYAN